MAEGALAAWAAKHGLSYEPQGSLPDSVPLLAMGTGRSSSDVMTGELAEGVQGRLANYVYTTTDSDGDTVHHSFAVAVCGIPESIGFAPRLFCLAKGAGATKGVPEDSFQEPEREVSLDSGSLADRFDISVASDVADNWIRQLFSPSFIGWLSAELPKGMSFQLTDGALCVYMKGTASTEERLERLRQATVAIATRIREECREEAGMDDAAHAAIGRSRYDALVDRKVAEIAWPEPPADAAAAIAAYRAVARKMVRPYLAGLASGVVAAVAIVLSLGIDPRFDVVVGVVGGIVSGVTVTRQQIGDRARRFGLESFAREYAKSRGLRTVEARSFQARHMTMTIPGVAEQVLAGILPGGLDGELALCRDKSRRRQPADHLVAVSGGRLVLAERSSARERRSARELDEFCRKAAGAATTAG